MPAWIMRALLAALLLFMSEIVLWIDPPGRSVQDWALLLVGYVILAALLLDWAARHRIRDVYGLLALAGIYGLLNGLLLNPQTALADVPLTWATRVMGAHTLVGFGALVLLLAFGSGHIRRIWLAAAVIGLLWGIWVRGLPTFTDITTATDSLVVVLLPAALVLVLLIALIGLAGGRGITPLAMRLSLTERLIAAGGLIALYLIHQPHIDSVSLLVLLSLAGFCWLLLWFEQRPQGSMLLDSALPMRSPSLPGLLIGAALFLGCGALGFSLPLADIGPLDVMVGLFAAFGLVWLPTVSLVLGVRAYRSIGRRQTL